MLSILAAVALAAPPQVFLNGNIHTMDAARPRAEAIAVEGARIIAVGSRHEALAAAGVGAETIDLAGRTVLPGLIDAHGHMANLGRLGLGLLDLRAAPSYEHLVAEVARRAAARPAGEWILGGFWDHENWPGRQLPTHEALSLAVPDHPVYLRRVDGHAALANRRAMQLAGITRDTPSPAGGEIVRDERGNPTGILVDNAMRLVARHVPPGLTGEPESLLLKAQEICLAYGLTGVHDMGIAPDDVEVYRRLDNAGKLKLRIYAAIGGIEALGFFEDVGPIIGERLTVRAAKFYIDGAMGSRGAWLLAPYADRPEGAEGKPYTGLAVNDMDLLRMIAEHAVAAEYQLCIHAIGDRANRELLNIYEEFLGEEPWLLRFRIEHAQLLHPDDLGRFARLGIIASMQPAHAVSDMRWVEARVGPERARGAYAWASLLRTGAVIAAGSDFPVEPPSPFLGIYAAVTRQDVRGQPRGGWFPGERMTREEALRAFTLGAAFASFEERDKGSLAPGKLADFIVIDRDIMTCPAPEILGARVLRTVIAGETVYTAPKEQAP